MVWAQTHADADQKRSQLVRDIEAGSFDPGVPDLQSNRHVSGTSARIAADPVPRWLRHRLSLHQGMTPLYGFG